MPDIDVAREWFVCLRITNRQTSFVQSPKGIRACNGIEEAGQGWSGVLVRFVEYLGNELQYFGRLDQPIGDILHCEA